jgi:uncharacterized membrane protein YkoI
MSQKTMIALAASLTAFVLVIAGGVFARLSGAGAASEPVAAVSPAVGDLWNQREAAYQSLIDQANQRLLAAEPSPTASTVSAAADSDQALAAYLSPAEAATLALIAAPGAGLTAQPELVAFQGIPAYEVSTTFGMVYVDATTGSVLYNGTVQMTVAAAQDGWDDDEYDD